MSLQELISYLPPSIAEIANCHVQRLDEMQSKIDSLMMNLGTSTPDPLVNSIVYKESGDDIKVTPTCTPSLPFLATMEPADTLLMGDEVISTIPARETDKFTKSSVDDLVPIPKQSEVTSDSVLECDMPATTPLPPTDNGKVDFDINSPLGEQVVDFLIENVDVADLPRHIVKQLFGLLLKNLSLTKGMSDELLRDAILDINLLLEEHLDTLSIRDKEINFNPIRDIEELERLLADDPVPVPRVFDVPLGNSDSMYRSSETSDLHEELITEFGLDDSIPTEIDDRYHDSKGDTLFFGQLLNEDTSSYVSLAFLPTESSLLVLPLHDPRQVCLREVERFDPFFSLTQSGDMTWVMDRPSYRFPHMPSPRPAVYSPKEVMYCYYHPHLTSGDGFDHGPKMK
ncbi:hypothetical protein Tco_0663271 [Tanacetum coccineum]